MINFIETLFGIAIGAAIAAIIFFIRKKKERGRQAALFAIVAAVMGGLLEVYVRLK